MHTQVLKFLLKMFSFNNFNVILFKIRVSYQSASESIQNKY